jgi:outer membrane receptor protein involved in Fe transport
MTILSKQLPPLTAIAAAISVALAAPGANAQAQATDLEQAGSIEEVIVSATRIKRKDFVSSSPVVTTDARAIAQSGTNTVEDFLRQMPQFQPGSGGFSNSSSGGTVGQATLNLRGLGPQRNLVIMDGRRLQPSSSNGAIDINTIPSLAIGSVEVISGGASATYGSDAMSGVVNFKTRTDLEGWEFSSQFNSADDGVGDALTTGLAFGSTYDDGKGNFLFSAEYIDRDGISVQERDFFADPVPSGFIPYNRTTPDNAPDQAAVDALMATYGLSGISNRSFFGVNDDGSVFAVSRGSPINFRGPTEAPFINSEEGFGYNPGYFNYIQVPLERYTLFLKSDYDLTDSVTAYGQVQYASSEAQNIGSEPVLASPWNVAIPIDNPFVQANSEFAALMATRSDPTAPIDYLGRVAQAGPRTYNTEADTWQVLFGLSGDFDGRDLNWDIHASVGEAENSDFTTDGSVSVSALQTLADAADGGASICDGGYQIFNGLNQLSQDCLSYISRTPTNTTTLEQTNIEAVLEGKAFDLPAGQARFALSANYRENSYRFDPDADIAANDLASLSATQFTEGEIDVAEVAAELFIPLLSDKPGVDSLNATLGFRSSDYNLSGQANTYKVEFDWQISDPILLRAGFQRALRAPNVEEFFNAGTQQVTGIGSPTSGGGDPCDLRNPALEDPNVADLCVATGLDPNLLGRFRQPANSIVTTTFGDASLDPEEADTFTFGAVWNPNFEQDMLSDLRISIDYYQIEIDRAIAAVPAAQTLQKCYNLDGSNPDYDPENFFCQQFERDSGGIFNFVNQPYLNLGGFQTAGVDVAVDWSIPLSFNGGDSSLNLNSFTNYLQEFKIATFEDSPFQENAGTISSGDSYPELKVVNTATLTLGDFSLTGRWRHTSSMDDSSTISNPNSETQGVPSYNYVDLSAAYSFQDRYEFRLGVNNLEDKTPPVVADTSAVTNPGVYDVVGRSFYLTAKFRL